MRDKLMYGLPSDLHHGSRLCAENPQVILVFLAEIPISEAIRFAEILGSSPRNLFTNPSRGMGCFFRRRTTNEPA